MVRHRVVVSALMVIMLFHGASNSSAFSGKMAEASNDPYITVTVRSAELVFVGSIERLLPSDCLPSGLGQSLQGIVFRVRRVLKGDLNLREELTAYYIVLGDQRLEVLIDGCYQLAPKVFEAGRQFIVACDRNTRVDPKGRWEILEGPWLADRDAEKMVVKAIAKGDVGLAQRVWLINEIKVERFIQGKDVPGEDVLRAIWRLGELSGSQSSQQGKGIDSLSRSGLQLDLEGWRLWYEKYRQCLVFDKNEMNVFVDEGCVQ